MKLFKQIPPLIDTKRFNNNNNNNNHINIKHRKWVSPLKNNAHTLYKSNSYRNILHHHIPPIKLPSQFNVVLQPVVSSNNNLLSNHKLNYKHLYNMDRNKGLYLYLNNYKHHLSKRNTSPQANTNLNMCYNIKPVKRIIYKYKQLNHLKQLMKDEGSSTREDIHNLLY